VGGGMAGRSGEDRMRTGSARSSRLARNEARMHSWLWGGGRGNANMITKKTSAWLHNPIAARATQRAYHHPCHTLARRMRVRVWVLLPVGMVGWWWKLLRRGLGLRRFGGRGLGCRLCGGGRPGGDGRARG
jgi:hypothetical protein